MLKVKYSKVKRAVLLDFSGEVGAFDIKGAEKEVGAALKDIGKGYTLIEVFHDNPHFTMSASKLVGDLAACCYDDSRI